MHINERLYKLRNKKTKLMIIVEAKANKGIRELLIELYKTKTFEDIVLYLKLNYQIDITVSGLSRWFLKLGIPTREWRLPEEKEPEKIKVRE